MLENKQRITKLVCKLIAELLGTDKRVLREIINRLEHASGAPGVDLRLAGEIYGTLNMKMRELGLDPNDTTPQELYQSLLNLTALHDKFLANHLGVKDYTNPETVLPAMVDLVNRMPISKQSWALKQTAAKKLLKALPPKNLMKLMHYRSIDSMLKREPTAMLLAAARHTEPESWLQRFISSYKRLHSNDFEVRDIEIMYMGNKRWRHIGQALIAQHTTAIIHSPEIAAIAILPLPTGETHGLTLASLLLIIHTINEIKTYSTLIKFHHMSVDFGKFLVNTQLQPQKEHARLAGQPIHWRIIHRYYGSEQQQNHPEIFEPHIQPEDLAYREAESILYRLEPALRFWHNLDYVGMPQTDGAEPISFSLMDMAMNLVNQTSYEKRSNYHLRDSIWNELHGRYLGQPSLERQLLKQLDEQVISEPSLVNDLEFAW